MSDTSEKWRRMGEDYQSKYDSPETIFEREKVRRLDTALALSEIDDDDTVVDIGVGAGHLLDRVVSASSVRPVGVDVSKSMIESASRVADASFLQGSVDCLPLADDTADVVFCLGVLGHIADDSVPAAIEECSRILSPGGQLVVSFANVRSPFRGFRDRYMRVRGIQTNYSTLHPSRVDDILSHSELAVTDRRYLTYSTALLNTKLNVGLYSLFERVGNDSRLLSPLAMTWVIACRRASR